MSAFNNLIAGSGSVAGRRPITNGHNWDLIQTGFSIDLNVIPSISEGFIPAGTPLVCDFEASTAVPLKTAKATAASSAKTITVAKRDEWSLNTFVVGDTICVMGSNLTTAATSYAKITAITDGDEATTITVGTSMTIAEGDVLINCKADGTMYGEPNAIVPFAFVKEDTATSVFTEAARSIDGDIYERRIPVMPNLVKVALYNNGCRFGFNNSK